MRLRLQLALWACVLYTLYCQSNSSGLQSNVHSYIKSMCHVTHDCTGAHEEDRQAENLIGNTCCKGCPCGDICPAERVAESFSDLVECRVPTPNNTFDRRLMRYKFVVKEPIGGCIKDHNLSTKGDHPSCSPEMVTSLGSNFYPVYSRDKQVNFKNKNCALCHGAKDLVYWDVYSTYEGKKARDLQTITNNYKNFKSDEIFRWLEAPNKESRRYTNMCYVVRDQCEAKNEGRLKFPKRMNMTKHEVRQACEQGPRFLYNAVNKDFWYKNVFCALCNGAPINYDDLGACEDSEGTRNMVKPFTFLFNRDYIRTEIEQVQTSTKKRNWACSKETNRIDDDSCREVLCPLLQVRLHDGRCDYPFDTFQIDIVHVQVNLRSCKTIDRNILTNMASKDVLSLFQCHSPWPKFWKILDVKMRNDVIGTDSTEFTVNLAFFPLGSVNLRVLHNSLKGSFNKPWNLYVNVNESINFSQGIYEHGLLTKESTNDQNTASFTPAWIRFNKDYSFLRDVDIPSWILIFVDLQYVKFTSQKIAITKTFLCDQIRLHPNEYVYIRDNMPLFVKNGNKLLYPNEYHVYLNKTGGEIVVICLEDSIFQTKLFGNGAEEVTETTKFILLMLLPICLGDF